MEELASSGRQKYQETLNLYHGKPSSDSASKAKLKSKLGTAGVKEGAAVTSRDKGRKERERRAFDEREGADTDDDVDEGIENILDQLGVRKRKSSPKDSEEKKNKKEKSHTKSNSNNIKGRRGQKKEEDVDEEKYEGPESSPSSSSSSVVCNGSTLAIVSSTVAVVALIGSYFMTQL